MPLEKANPASAVSTPGRGGNTKEKELLGIVLEGQSLAGVK